MKTANREFMGRKIFINEMCDHFENAPIRTHRKKRLRKKFLKKYGWRQILVSDMFLTEEGYIVIGPKAFQELLKEAEKFNLPGRRI